MSLMFLRTMPNYELNENSSYDLTDFKKFVSSIEPTSSPTPSANQQQSSLTSLFSSYVGKAASLVSETILKINKPKAVFYGAIGIGTLKKVLENDLQNYSSTFNLNKHDTLRTAARKVTEKSLLTMTDFAQQVIVSHPEIMFGAVVSPLVLLTSYATIKDLYSLANKIQNDAKKTEELPIGEKIKVQLTLEKLVLLSGAFFKLGATLSIPILTYTIISTTLDSHAEKEERYSLSKFYADGQTRSSAYKEEEMNRGLELANYF